MKRCPECDSTFPDADKFCELDGTPLVADDSDSNPDLSVALADKDAEPGLAVGADDEEWETDSEEDVGIARGFQPSRDAGPGQNWKTLAIVAVAGVSIGIVAFIIYQRMTRETPEQSSNESYNQAVSQQQGPLLPSRPSPIASPTPSAEPSASPSATPSPAPPKEAPRLALSSSPVSTGGDAQVRRGPVTIRLANGTSVEAEEVWETGEGIWYRRRGIVTLLERDQVTAIEKPSPTPSPSATPATSPSASP